MSEQTGGRSAAVPQVSIMNILGSDGTLRLTVPEGTEGAVRRDYETSDGKKGTKYELVFKSLSGRITNMQMYEGDYGKNLLVTLTYEGGEDTISFNTSSPYGEDFMKKLPKINLDEFVTISPYSFMDENGKTRRGVTVTQGDVKLQNHFYDPEKKKNLHKYPNPEGDTDKFDKDDWKIYFTQCRKFLVKYTEDTFLPAFAHKSAMPAYPEEDGNLADKF